jgi:phage terminase large subunit
MDALAALEAKVDSLGLTPPQEDKDSVDRAFDFVVNRAAGTASNAQPHDSNSNDPSLHDSNSNNSRDEVLTTRVSYDFEDPLELAQLLHENVRFHKWQSDISYKLAKAKPTQFNPYKLCLTACNGSGKDAFVIAPFVVWFLLTRIDALAVVTSSSGVQLTAQTETYIARMCNSFNAKVGRRVFKVIKRHIICLDTGSECRLFATDEPGKAEGYHPLVPGGEMAIISNEAKSIEEAIFEALSRCTGFNYWLEVSTPGEPIGHFYLSNVKAQELGYDHQRITSYDCPHKDPLEIERDRVRYGERSPLFRSKHLALFTQVDGQFVIGLDQVNRCRERCKTHIGPNWKKRVGIDVALSNGGDETNVYVTVGNKLVNKLTLHTDNISQMAVDIDAFMTTEGIPKDSDLIFIDDGGVGRALWPLLQERGWTGVQRILNQFPAFNKTEFANRGTEMWFNLARLIEEGLVLLPDDGEFTTQLTSRKYRRSIANGKIILESKREMKAEGQKSPDRVDAFVLSLHGLTVEDFNEELRKGNTSEVKRATQAARSLTAEELIEKPFFVSQRRRKAQLVGEAVETQEPTQKVTFASILGNITNYARRN